MAARVRELDASIMLFADLAVTVVVLQSLVARSVAAHLPWLAVVLPLVLTNLVAAWVARRRGFTALPFGANTVFVMVVFGDLLVGVERGLAMVAAALLLYAVIVWLVTVVVLRFRPTLPRQALMLPLAAICTCYLVLTPILQLAREPPAVWLGAALLWILLTRRAPAAVTWLLPLLVWAGLAWLTHGAWQPREMVVTLELASVVGLGAGEFLLAPDFWQRVAPVIALLATANAFANLENVASAHRAGDDHDAHVANWIACGGTSVAALCGAGAPTTVYIGHPVYKRLGGRSRYVVYASLALALMLVPLGSWLMRWAPVFVLYGAVIYIGTGVATMVRHQVGTVRQALAAALPMVPIFAFWSQNTFHLSSPALVALARGSALVSVGWAMLLWSDGGRAERLVVCLLLAGLSVAGVVHAPAVSPLAWACAAAYAALALFVWRRTRS